MKKLSLLTAHISILLLPLLMLIFAPVAHAQTQAWTGVCVGTKINIVDYNNNTSSADATTVPTIQGLQCLIGNILSVAITGIGLIGFVMFIVGAFFYMLSGGNAKGTETAKNTITYAIIGLVVALSAFIILNLIAAFTGVSSILNFSIPGATSGTPTQQQPAPAARQICAPANCQQVCGAGFVRDPGPACANTALTCCKPDLNSCAKTAGQSCQTSCNSNIETPGVGTCTTGVCCAQKNAADCLSGTGANQICVFGSCDANLNQSPGVGACIGNHAGQTCCMQL